MRAFIAAPLLGTIIFLAAVLFVVHVTESERAAVETIVQDVYNKRVTTMLEDYRSDLQSLFALSVSRSIEKFLTSECWTFFSLSN